MVNTFHIFCHTPYINLEILKISSFNIVFSFLRFLFCIFFENWSFRNTNLHSENFSLYIICILETSVFRMQFSECNFVLWSFQKRHKIRRRKKPIDGDIIMWNIWLNCVVFLPKPFIRELSVISQWRPVILPAPKFSSLKGSVGMDKKTLMHICHIFIYF